MDEWMEAFGINIYQRLTDLLLVTAASLVTTQLILMKLMLWYGSANVVAVESQGIIWASLASSCYILWTIIPFWFDSVKLPSSKLSWGKWHFSRTLILSLSHPPICVVVCEAGSWDQDRAPEMVRSQKCTHSNQSWPWTLTATALHWRSGCCNNVIKSSSDRMNTPAIICNKL